MAIIDMKRGDAYIVRAYRGEDLIFQRGNPYIERVDNYSASDPEYSKDTYIYVDDVELMYNWKYEAEVSGLSDNPTGRNWCFLGGSFDRDNTTGSHWLHPIIEGIFFGCKQTSDNTVYETLMSQDLINRFDNPRKDVPVTVGSKHIVTLKLDTMPTYHYGDNPYQATVDGFHLLSARNAITFTQDYITYTAGEALNMGLGSVGSLYKNKGRVYRISLYDENNVLIHNYIPKIVDGHKGMLDTVINKFYACSDDTKFNIGLG